VLFDLLFLLVNESAIYDDRAFEAEVITVANISSRNSRARRFVKEKGLRRISATKPFNVRELEWCVGD